MKKSKLSIRLVSMILCAVLFMGEFGAVAAHAAEPEVTVTESQPASEATEMEPVAETPENQPTVETPEAEPVVENAENQPAVETTEAEDSTEQSADNESPAVVNDGDSFLSSDPENITKAFENFNDRTVTPSDVVSNTVIEQNGSLGDCVAEIEMNGNVATVSFGVSKEATVIVSVFDNENKQMLASGWADINPDMETVNVTISNGEMPTYYYLRSYIVERDTLTPLSIVYVSNYYTRSIQEFLAKTPEDFENAGESVLMLEEEGATEDSFAVLADEVVVVYCDPDEAPDSDMAKDTEESLQEAAEDDSLVDTDDSQEAAEDDSKEVAAEDSAENDAELKTENDVESEGDVSAFTPPTLGYAQNELIAYDEDYYTFTFANPGLELTAIANRGKGKFVYKYKNMDMMVIDAWTARFDNDGNVVLSAKADTNIEDFFKNVKIDEKDKEVTNADGSEADSGVELVSGSADGGIGFKFKISSLFKAKSDGSKPEVEKAVKVEGEIKPDITLGLSGKFSCKTVYTKDEKFSTAKFTVKFTVDGTIEASGKVAIRLCKLTFKYAAFTAEVPLYLVFGGNLTVGLSYSKTFEIGTEFHSYGNVPIRKCGKDKLEAQFDGTIEVGIMAEVELSILCKAFASVKLTTYVGAQLTLSAAGSIDDEVKHDCHNLCFEGSLSVVAFVEVSGKIIGIFSGKVTLLNVTLASVPAYLCLYSGHKDHLFDLKPCPDKRYRTIISVYDKKNQPVVGLDVTIKDEQTNDEESFKTNKAGQVVKYLSNGKYKAIFTYSTGTKVEQDFKVNDAARSIYLYDNVYVGNIKKLVTSDNFTIVLTADGKVYSIGNNSEGQLGIGTTVNSTIPAEVTGIGTVKDIEVGGNTAAAITTSGDLYVWGSNRFGQLGDETVDGYVTTPQKVNLKDKVKQISLSRYTAGAITQGGALYMWGNNSSGQIGNGTHGNTVYKPVKITVDGNEVPVLLEAGDDITGVVTKTNKLYTWGSNEYYKLGVGYINNDYLPHYVKTDNIVSLAFGDHVSGYVNAAGDFYEWGSKRNVGSNGCNCYYGSYLLYGTDFDRTDLTKPAKNKYFSNAKAVYMDECFTGIVAKDGKFIYGGYFNGVIYENRGEYSNWADGDLTLDMALSSGRFFMLTSTNIIRLMSNKLYIYNFNEGSSKTTNSSGDKSAGNEVVELLGDISSVEGLPGDDVASTVSGNELTLSLSGLEADTIYNVYATKIPEKENVLSGSDSLLCIDQLTSDGSGCINATMYMQEEYDNPCILTAAMTKKDIAGAEIAVEDADSTGGYILCNPVVTYGDRVLKEGKDYELYSGFAGIGAGTYNLVIRGIGEFGGYCNAQWKINPSGDCVSIMLKSLSTGGYITSNTYVKIPDSILEDAGAYVSIPGEDILISDLDTADVDGEIMHIVRCKCSARDYDVPMPISFYTGEDVIISALNSVGDPIDGGIYMSSIKDYIDDAKTADEGTAERIVSENLENYCIFAKAYLGDGSVGIPAIESIGNHMNRITADDFAKYAKEVTGSVDGLDYMGSSLLLKSETRIRHYFKVKSGYDISSFNFKINEEILEPAEVDGVYYIDICGVPASQYRNKYTLTVTAEDGKILTLTYSVNSYIYSVLSKDSPEGLVGLAKALSLYDSAVKTVNPIIVPSF